jgi:hypothetical protein
VFSFVSLTGMLLIPVNTVHSFPLLPTAYVTDSRMRASRFTPHAFCAMLRPNLFPLSRIKRSEVFGR